MFYHTYAVPTITPCRPLSMLLSFVKSVSLRDNSRVQWRCDMRTLKRLLSYMPSAVVHFQSSVQSSSFSQISIVRRSSTELTDHFLIENSHSLYTNRHTFCAPRCRPHSVPREKVETFFFARERNVVFSQT